MRVKLGSRFFQRLFASPNGSNPSAPAVGSDPHDVKLSFKWNVGPTAGRKRRVSAEALDSPFKPDLGTAELRNGVIDAAIATTNEYNKKKHMGILLDEEPAAAQARWLNKKGENSYHSGIVSNPMHSQKATAYDICIGTSEILKDNELIWIRFLRAAADWRTNWFGTVDVQMQNDPSFPPPLPDLVQMLDDASKIPKQDRDVIVGTYNYYCIDGAEPGKLPSFTTACKVESLAPYVISETSRDVQRERNENSHQYGY